MDANRPLQEADKKESKGFLGRRPKPKFSKVLCTASQTKNSLTWQRYNEAIARGVVNPTVALPVATLKRSGLIKAAT